MNSHFSAGLLQAGAPFIAGVTGGALGVVESRYASPLPLVSFAAGAFAVAALGSVLPEAAEQVGWLAAVLIAVSGFGLTVLLARWAGSACPACEGAHSVAHLTLEMSLPLIVALTIHSTMDGLALATPGGSGAEASGAGSLLSLALFAHKLPEGLAIAALSRASGASPGRALALVIAIEACTFLGLAAGTVVPWSPHVLGSALALVAGSFVFIAGIALQAGANSGKPLRELGAAAIGAGLILLARIVER